MSEERPPRDDKLMISISLASSVNSTGASEVKDNSRILSVPGTPRVIKGPLPDNLFTPISKKPNGVAQSPKRQLKRTRSEQNLLPSLRNPTLRSMITDPTSAERRHWNLVVIICLFYNIITVPIRLGFIQFWYYQSSYAAFLFFDCLSDLLFVLDIAIIFYTPFLSNGIYVHDLDQIRERYVHGWFIIDVIATFFPLDLTFLGLGIWYQAAFRLTRLLRIFKIDYYFDAWERRFSSYVSTLRLLKLLTLLCVLFHIFGCMYMGLAYTQGFGSSSFLPDPSVQEYSFGNQYFVGFTWAVILSKRVSIFVIIVGVVSVEPVSFVDIFV